MALFGTLGAFAAIWGGGGGGRTGVWDQQQQQQQQQQANMVHRAIADAASLQRDL